MNERIPKIKKTQIKNNLQSVDVNNRDVQHLLREINKTCLDTEFPNQWEAIGVSMVHNAELESSYIKKRSELKDEGRTAASLLDQLGFLVANPSCKTSIMTKGLMATRQSGNRLGKGECGVYINRFFDIELKYFWKQGDISKEIIVFKYFYGKRKAITLNCLTETEASLEPTPNYDCHTSSSHPKKEDSLYRQHALSSIYLYEYTDACEPAKFPRQSLPYAVIKCKQRLVVPKSTISNHQVLSKKENQPNSTKTAPVKSLKTPAIDGNTTPSAVQKNLPLNSNSKLSPSPSCPRNAKSNSDMNQNATVQSSTRLSHGVNTNSKVKLLPGKDLAKKIDKRSAGSMEEFLHQTPQYLDRLNVAYSKLQHEHDNRNMDMISSILPNLLPSPGAPVENHLPQPSVTISSKCVQGSSGDIRDPRLNKSAIKVPDKTVSSIVKDRTISQTTTSRKPKNSTSETKKMSYSEYVRLKAVEKESKKGDIESQSESPSHSGEKETATKNPAVPSKTGAHKLSPDSYVEDVDCLPLGIPKSISSDYLSKFQPPEARPNSKSELYSQFQSPQARQMRSKSDLYSLFQSPIPPQHSSSQNLFQSLTSNPMTPVSPVQKNYPVRSNSLPSSSPKSRLNVEKKAFLPFPVLCEDGSVKNVYRGTRDGSVQEMPSSSSVLTSAESKCEIEKTKKCVVESESPSQNVKEGADKLFKAFQNVFADGKNKKLIQRQLSNGKKEDAVNVDQVATAKELSVPKKGLDVSSKENETVLKNCEASFSHKNKADNEHGNGNITGDKAVDCSLERKQMSACITSKKLDKHSGKCRVDDHERVMKARTSLRDDTGNSSKHSEAKRNDKNKKRSMEKEDLHKEYPKSSTEHRKDVTDKAENNGKSRVSSISKSDCIVSRLDKSLKSDEKRVAHRKGTGSKRGVGSATDVKAQNSSEKEKEYDKKLVKNKGGANNKSKKNIRKGNVVKDSCDKDELLDPNFEETLDVENSTEKGKEYERKHEKKRRIAKKDSETNNSNRRSNLGNGISLKDGSHDSDISRAKHAEALSNPRVVNQSTEEEIHHDEKLLNDQQLESELNSLYEKGSLLPNPSKYYPRFICRSPNADIPGIHFSLDLSAQIASSKSYCSPLRLIPSLCSDDLNDLKEALMKHNTVEQSPEHLEETLAEPIVKEASLLVSKPEESPLIPVRIKNTQSDSTHTILTNSSLIPDSSDESQSVSNTVEKSHPITAPLDKCQSTYPPIEEESSPIEMPACTPLLVGTHAKEPSHFSGSLHTSDLFKGIKGKEECQTACVSNIGQSSVSSVQRAVPTINVYSNSSSQHEVGKDVDNREVVIKESLSSSCAVGNAGTQKSPSLSSSSSPCLFIDENCESNTSVCDKQVKIVEQCETDSETNTQSSSDDRLSENDDDPSDEEEDPLPLPRSLSMEELGFGFYLQALTDKKYQPSTVVLDFKEAIEKRYHHNECKTCRKELTSGIMAKYINDIDKDDSSSKNEPGRVQESEAFLSIHEKASRSVSSNIESKIDADYIVPALVTAGSCRGETSKEKEEQYHQNNCTTVKYDYQSSGSHNEVASQKLKKNTGLDRVSSSPHGDALESYKAKLIQEQDDRNELMRIKERLSNKRINKPVKRRLSGDENKIDALKIEDDDELRDTLLEDWTSATSSTGETYALQSSHDTSDNSCHYKSKSQSEMDSEERKIEIESAEKRAQDASSSVENDSNKHPLDLYDMLEDNKCELHKSKILTKIENKTFNFSMVPRAAQKFMKKKEIKVSKPEMIPLDSHVSGKNFLCNSSSNDSNAIDKKLISENCDTAKNKKTKGVCIDEDEADKPMIGVENHAKSTKWKPIAHPGKQSDSEKQIQHSNDFQIKSINLSLSTKCKSEKGNKIIPPKDRSSEGVSSTTPFTGKEQECLIGDLNPSVLRKEHESIDAWDLANVTNDCHSNSSVDFFSKSKSDIDNCGRKTICEKNALKDFQQWRPITAFSGKSGVKSSMSLASENPIESESETIHEEEDMSVSVPETLCSHDKSDCEVSSSSNISPVQRLKSPDLSLYLNQPLGDVDYRVGFHMGRQVSAGLPTVFSNLGGCGSGMFVSSSVGNVDYGDVDYRTHPPPANCSYKSLNINSVTIENKKHQGSILSPEVIRQSSDSLQANDYHKENANENVEYHESHSISIENTGNKNDIEDNRKLLIWPSIEPDIPDCVTPDPSQVEINSNIQTVKKLIGSCENPDSHSSIIAESTVSTNNNSVTPILAPLSNNQTVLQKDTYDLSEKKLTLENSFPPKLKQNSVEDNNFQPHLISSDNGCTSKSPLIDHASKGHGNTTIKPVLVPLSSSSENHKCHESGPCTEKQSGSINASVATLVPKKLKDYWMKPREDCDAMVGNIKIESTFQTSSTSTENCKIGKENKVTVCKEEEKIKKEVISQFSLMEHNSVKHEAVQAPVKECKEEDNNAVENIRKCLPDILGTPKTITPEMAYKYSEDEESDEENDNTLLIEEREALETPTKCEKSKQENLETSKISLTQDHVSMLKRAISTVTQCMPSCNSATTTITIPLNNEGPKKDIIEAEKIDLTQDHVSMLKKAISTVTNVKHASELVKDKESNKEVFETEKVSLTPDQLSMLKSAVHTFTHSIPTRTKQLELNSNSNSDDLDENLPFQSSSKCTDDRSTYLGLKEKAAESTVKALLRNYVDEFDNYDFSLTKQSPKGRDKAEDILCAFVNHLSNEVAVNIMKLKQEPISSCGKKEVKVVKSFRECSSDSFPGTGENSSNKVNEKAKELPSDSDSATEENKVLLSDVPLEALTRAKLHVLEQLNSLNEDDDLEEDDDTIVEENYDEQDEGGFSEKCDFLPNEISSTQDEQGEYDSESESSLGRAKTTSMPYTTKTKSKIEIWDISSDSDMEELRAPEKKKRSIIKDDERLVVHDTSLRFRNSSPRSQSPFIKKKNYDDYIEIISSPSDRSSFSSPIVSRRISSSRDKSFISKSRHVSSDIESPLLSNENSIKQNSNKNRTSEIAETSKVKFQDLKICLDNSNSNSQNRKVKSDNKRRVVVSSSLKDVELNTESRDKDDPENIIHSFLKSVRSEVESNDNINIDKGKRYEEDSSKDVHRNSSPETRNESIQDGHRVRDNNSDKPVKDMPSDVWKRISLRPREQLSPQGATEYSRDQPPKKPPIMELCKDRREKNWLKDHPFDKNQNIASQESWGDERPLAKYGSKEGSRNRSPDTYRAGEQTGKGRQPLDYDQSSCDRYHNSHPEVWRERRKREEDGPLSSDRYHHSSMEDWRDGDNEGRDSRRRRLQNISPDVRNRNDNYRQMRGISPISSSASETAQVEYLSPPGKRRKMVSDEDKRRAAIQPTSHWTSGRHDPMNMQHSSNSSRAGVRARLLHDSDSEAYSGTGSFYSGREDSYSPKEDSFRRGASRISKGSPLERSLHEAKLSNSSPATDLVDYFSPPGNSDARRRNTNTPDNNRYRQEQRPNFARGSIRERPHPLDELMRPLQKRKMPDGEEELDYYLNRRESYHYDHKSRSHYNSRRY